MEVNKNNDPLDQQYKTIAFDKDIDHDVLLMNAKNKNKFVESNTLSEDDSIQLRTYSNLGVNTGVKLKDNPNVYQITQIQKNMEDVDIPIKIFGGRKVFKGAGSNPDILSDELTTFKSNEINTIVYASQDNLEKKPKYLNTKNEFEDNFINKRFKSQNKTIRDQSYIDDMDDIFSSDIQVAGSNTTESSDFDPEAEEVEAKEAKAKAEEVEAKEAKEVEAKEVEAKEAKDKAEEAEAKAEEAEAKAKAEEAEEAKAEEVEAEEEDVSKEISSEEMEFELDDIEMEDIDVVINEEEIIPEEKVISNERDQQNDLFNELMKMESEKDRSKVEYITKNEKILKRFSELKETYSIQNEIGDIISHKEFGDNYKPTLEDFLNNNFSNPQYFPLVTEHKKIYNSMEKMETFEQLQKIFNTPIDPIEINDIDAVKDACDIRNKYRKGAQRINYSYRNEQNETWNLSQAYQSIPSEVGYETVLLYDTTVINNCFKDKNCMTNGFDSHIMNGPFIVGNPIEGTTDVIVEGSKITISGIVKFPEKHMITYPKKLVDCVNKTINYPRKQDIVENYEQEIINLDFNKNDKIKVCFNDKGTPVEIKGTIVDIGDNGETYIIKPDVEYPDQKLNILRVNKRDKNIVFKKDDTLLKINDNDRLCFDVSRDKYSVYLFPEVTNKEMVLNNVFPDVDVIINANYDKLKNAESFEEMHEILNKYDLEINSLSYNNFKVLSEILDSNINKILSKQKKKKSAFETFLKKKDTNPKKQNFQINNNSLEEMAKYYGDYPYYNTNIDSNSERFKFLHMSPDNGYLYYKNIINKISEKLTSFKAKALRNVQTKLSDLESKKRTLELTISQLLSIDTDCPEYRLVKIYKSIEELNLDNEKEFIAIDEDKIVPAEKTNMVREGQYAIVEKSLNERLLYKRHKLASGKEMWIKEDGKNIDNIIKTNKDFCNMASNSLDELTPEFFNENKCSFSDENGCVNKNIIKLENDLKEIKENHDDLKIQESMLINSESSLKNLEKVIAIQKNKLQLYQTQIRRKYEDEVRKYQDIIVKEADEEHKTLYNKIDRYLSNITLLDKAKYYEALEVLKIKYGRDAQDEDENIENVYCVKGKKVLFCKHHNMLMELYKNADLKSKDNEEIYTNMIEKYGIEHEGKYWCRNCGQELGLAEFETIEGFDKSTGAHLVTHEELVDEDAEPEIKDEMMLALQNYLKESSLRGEDDSINTIIEILDVLLDLMGVNLLPKDKLDLLKQCESLDKSISSKKGRMALLIINISCALFIKLQVSIPPYKITKAHAKCASSLQGYPLVNDNTDTRGIEYVACILNNLKDSGDPWKDLKKVKNIKKTMLKIIDVLIKENYIEYTLVLKRQYLLRRIEEDNVVLNTWNEFKPSLGKQTINLEENEPVVVDTLKGFTNNNINKLRDNFNEKLNLLSLKIIEIYNNEINTQKVENHLFNPTPIDNSCCLEQLNDNYSYNNFFGKEVQTNINSLNESLKTMNESKKVIIDNPINLSQNVYPEIVKSDLPSFSKDIYPESTQITAESIKKLYLKFISNGENLGEKHIYNSDNLCVLTGQNKNEILKSNYGIEDYDELMRNMNIKKRYNDKKKNIQVKVNPLDGLSYFIDNNKLMNSLSYFQSLKDNLSNVTLESQDKLFTDLESQITIEIDDLVNILSKNLFIKKPADIKKLTETLNNIGIYNNLYEENKEILGENEAEKVKHKDQCLFIKRHIHYIETLLSKIINQKKMIDEENISFIKQNLKLNPMHVEKLLGLYSKDNDLIEYFGNSLNEQSIDAFNKIKNVISNNINGINLIIGRDHVYDCYNNIETLSEITHKGSALILHYIFINLLNNICRTYTSEGLSPLDNRVEDDEDALDMRGGADSNPKNLDELDVDLEELEPKVAVEKSKEKVDKSKVSDEKEEDEAPPLSREDADNIEEVVVEVDLTPDDRILENKNTIINDFINKVITSIGNNNDFIDKYTTKHVTEVIDTQYENEKEANLKFMEELDKESRQSFKALLAMGVESYKNLSIKKKELYMAIPEADEESHLTNEEQDSLNRNQAERALGSNFTEDQYQDWLQDKEHNQREDQLAYQEMEQLSDDDE